MINSIYWFAIAVIGALTVKKFGSATILGFVYALLATPTPLFGPPGIYKIVLGISLGLVVDIIALIFRYRNIAYYIAPVIGNILSVFELILAYKLLGLPGAEQIIAILPYMLLILSVEALIGGWLGIKIYNKIKDKRIIRQIQS